MEVLSKLQIITQILVIIRHGYLNKVRYIRGNALIQRSGRCWGWLVGNVFRADDIQEDCQTPCSYLFSLCIELVLTVWIQEIGWGTSMLIWWTCMDVEGLVLQGLGSPSMGEVRSLLRSDITKSPSLAHHYLRSWVYNCRCQFAFNCSACN